MTRFFRTAGGYTLAELAVYMACSALLLVSMLGWLSYTRTGLARVLAQEEANEQIQGLWLSLGAGLRDSTSILYVYKDTVRFVKSDGTFLYYHRNLAGQVIREVNGHGGEVVADHVLRLTFTMTTDRRGVNVDVATSSGHASVERARTFYSRLL